MLAAEFFEKTYRNDDHRSIVTPSESKSAKSSRRSSSNNNKNNSNRDGLKEFAVLVSEAYRQECSTNHHVCTSDAADKKSPTTVARHLSDRNSRNNPRANHKTSTAPTQNQTKDRSAEATKKTNIQQSQYQERQFQEKKSPPEYKTPVKDHRDRTNDHYCSSTETSPIGVVDEWVSIRGALSKEKKKKKSTVIPPTTIEVPVAGLLDIRDQVLIQERCEQEKILNRELKQKVFDLQNQISVLQKGKSSKINHYEDNSSNNDDDDSSNDGPNVSKDCSGILEELLTPISSSPSPPAVETLNPKKVTKQQSSSSKRNFKAQLEESKQVIQMLFKDLKISKQNESDLATKLKAANVALHKEKQRSRENTRIAMKSADDVRASLVSKLQYDHRKSSSRSSDNEEVELLKQELARAREECHRWKRKEQLARRSAEIRSKTLYQQDKENRKPTALRRQQVLESRKLTKNEAITGRRSPVDTSKQEKATPKPPQLMEDKPEMLSGVKNKNESRPTSSLSQCHTISQQMNSNPLEIAQKKREPRPTTSLSQCHAMSQPKSSNPEITEAKDKREPRPTSTLSQCHAVSQPKNSAHAVLNTKCEARPTSSLSQCHAISQQKNPKPSEEAKNSSTSEPLNGNQKQQSKLMGACSTSEDSVLPKRRLDFFSCVANDTETQGLLKSPKTTIKTFVAPPQDNKNDKKGNETLGELMMELKASKERLQTADEKLNRLVNKDGLLLDCKVVRKCDDPKFDGAIDVVNSSNDVIEVSHRSFAYV